MANKLSINRVIFCKKTRLKITQYFNERVKSWRLFGTHSAVARADLEASGRGLDLQERVFKHIFKHISNPLKFHPSDEKRIYSAI